MTNQGTIDRQVESDITKDVPVWKNLLFMKSGRTVPAAQVHSTEAEARAAIVTGEAELTQMLAKNPLMRVVCGKTRQHLFYVWEYSHAIPLPWGPA